MDDEIIHYAKFLDEFMTLPTSLNSSEEIESNKKYKREKNIFINMKEICLSHILNILDNKKFSYDYNNCIYDEMSDILKNYNDIDYMTNFVIGRLEFMLTIKNIPDEWIKNLIKINSDYTSDYTIELINKDNLYSIYDYIYRFRFNTFFNNTFFSKIFKDVITINNKKDYNIILISGKNHAQIIIKCNIDNTIFLFDPSYNIDYLNKYNAFIDIFGHTSQQKQILQLDVQHVHKLYLDIFCYFWCLHFVYFYFNNNVEPYLYVEMFKSKYVDTQLYYSEIKTFILKILRESPLYEEGKEKKYWNKYIKYKQKYLDLKKNLN